MSAIRTFTVTVSNPGAGNRYYIDGVLQETVNLAEGYTYKFDVSDSSVSGHPFKFSTTSNGTHSGGSEYTTGVTTSGTAGQSDAYVQITVADSAPQLYYYCQYHSGMGGSANTEPSDTWGLLQWNQNTWGSQDDVITSLTGVSASSSVGSPTITTEINTGWGQDGWGIENWGQSGLVVTLTGVEATTGIGADVSWGKQTWGSTTTGWGGEYYLDVANVMGLTGLSSTSSVGAPTAISDLTLTPTGQSSTSAIGSVNISFDIIVNPTGVSATSSTGALAPADVMGLTGLSATSALGVVSINSNPTVALTGLSMTSTAGALVPADVMGLTGVSATSTTGALVPADVMGLTGVSATASVGNVAPLGYETITATQTANYTAVTAGN